MIEGLRATMAEDRCWSMVKEDKHLALAEEYGDQGALGGHHDNRDVLILLLFLCHRGDYKRIIKELDRRNRVMD